MKVIFEDFTKFFQSPSQRGPGSRQPAEQPLQRPGQPESHGQKDRAAPGQPRPAAQGHGRGVIPPHRPGPLFQSHGQQRPAHPQPEAEIQHHPYAGPGKPAAKDAQQVIDRPGGQSQGQAQDQSPGLEGQIGLHQPSSRAKKPPFSLGAS